jgi:nucleotide-binding universal stress UspA family protein
MIHKILVPLDGTALAETALSPAVFFANALGAGVALLHVLEKKATSRVHEQRHLSGVKEAERYLNDIRSRFFNASQTAAVHVHTVAATDVANAIAMHVDEMKSDLIILCTHGRHLFTHPIFGSIGQRILASVTTPVLIVKPQGAAGPAPFRLERILVPVTADEAHPGGIAAAETLAIDLKAHLHTLLVVQRFGDISGDQTPVSRLLPNAMHHLLDLNALTGEKYLYELKSRLERTGLTATASVSRREPSKGIIEEAQRMNTDLIVMSTHRRKGLEAFWRGSVASRVCRRSSVPLLLVPEREGNIP